MADESLVLAMISEVFPAQEDRERLGARLRQARSLGAELAVLPELPLNSWCPATKTARPEDAEQPGGPRHLAMATAARDAGVWLLGGAITIDPVSGRRHNTAMLFDASGRLAGTYRKVHLPHEQGFWEAAHYEPGADPPSIVEISGMPVGIQVCSDAHRPEGFHILGAMGAEAILAPRATEAGTYDRWRLVLRADAVTSCAYVVSVNRPSPEWDVPLGGPSVAISPDGEPLLETTEPIGLVTLERAAARQSRTRYPGYLDIRADVYARGWEKAAHTRRS